jgi:hypothetical protein
MYLTALEGTEIISGKHPDTRIKPLPLTDGDGRYRYTRTDTCVRWEISVKYIAGKFLAVSLPMLGPPVPVLYVVIVYRTIAYLSIVLA